MSDRHASRTETPFQGLRVRYESAKSYAEVVDALLADIGDKPVPINDIAVGFDSWESHGREVASHAGPSGFMLFAELDHGAWLKKAGIDRHVLRVLLGNPLIAVTMLCRDLTAGLFAPVELLITEEAHGRSALTYVLPSSLMVVAPNEPLRSAAEALDDKLAALAQSVTA